jgi:hypothetical protein
VSLTATQTKIERGVSRRRSSAAVMQPFDQPGAVLGCISDERGAKAHGAASHGER